VGAVWIDAIRFDAAVSVITEMIRYGAGGVVFTPNVDHIVLAEQAAQFRVAYEAANLVVADGMPVLWASWLLRTPVPEKVSGSDLLLPLALRSAQNGWRVYVVGGAPGTAARAADEMTSRFGVTVAGVESPSVTVDGQCDEEEAILDRIRRARPDIIFVALGTPKQELWIDRVRNRLAPAVLIGVGAGLDFLIGRVPRAPRWMSSLGLEWLFRLAREPRRLWRRYLLRDPLFLLIVARALATPRSHRLRERALDPWTRSSASIGTEASTSIFPRHA
jgi:N-acetylglucosaminyldiphosphoundecaprenol N-acetyl-beta-D-mannosaminyltransferase